jgi:hypothetical protein
MPSGDTMAMTKVEVELQSAAVIRPGDTFVVATNRPISMAEADRMKDELGFKIPGVHIVIVPANALAVYRPDKKSEVPS